MSKTRLEELQDLLKADPNDSFVRYAIALEYQNSGDREGAIRYLEDLKQSNPEYLALYHPLGLLYEQRGEFEKAIAVYEEGCAAAVKKGDRHHKDFLQRSLDFLYSKRDH